MFAIAAMADDSMEISSEHGDASDVEFDIDIDLIAGQDEDYAIEDVAEGDDMMADDDNASFQMNDADILDEGDNEVQDQNLIGMSIETDIHDTIFDDDYTQVPVEEVQTSAPDEVIQEKVLDAPAGDSTIDAHVHADTVFDDQDVHVTPEESKTDVHDDATFDIHDALHNLENDGNVDTLGVVLEGRNLQQLGEEDTVEGQSDGVELLEGEHHTESIKAPSGASQDPGEVAEAKIEAGNPKILEGQVEAPEASPQSFEDLEAAEVVAADTFEDDTLNIFETEKLEGGELELAVIQDDELNVSHPEENQNPAENLDFEAPETTSAADDHHVRLLDTKVTYRDTEYKLFSTAATDDPDSFFLKNDTLVNQPLHTFLGAIREVISDDLGPEDLLYMAVEELGLEFDEVTISSSEDITLSNVMRLRDKLLQNDGVEDVEFLPPLHLTLGAKPYYLIKFINLEAAAAGGKGLSEVAISWDGSIEHLEEVNLQEDHAGDIPDEQPVGEKEPFLENPEDDLIDYSEDESDNHWQQPSPETNGHNTANEEHDIVSQVPRQRSPSRSAEGNNDISDEQNAVFEEGSIHGSIPEYDEEIYQDDFGLDFGEEVGEVGEAEYADESKLNNHETELSDKPAAVEDSLEEHLHLDDNATVVYTKEAFDDEIDFGDDEEVPQEFNQAYTGNETGSDIQQNVDGDAATSGLERFPENLVSTGSDGGSGEVVGTESVDTEHTLEAESDIKNGDELDEIDYDDDDVGDALGNEIIELAAVPASAATSTPKRARSDFDEDFEVQSKEAKRLKS